MELGYNDPVSELKQTPGQLTDNYLPSIFNWYGGFTFAPIYGRFEPNHRLKWDRFPGPEIDWMGAETGDHVGGLVAVAYRPAGEVTKVEPGDTTLAEFMFIHTPQDACAFATKWGHLGLATTGFPNWRLVEGDKPFGRPEDWIGGHAQDGSEVDPRSVLEVAMETFRTAAGAGEGDHPANLSEEFNAIQGEPIGLWLWHADRLRTWHRLYEQNDGEAIREAVSPNHPALEDLIKGDPEIALRHFREAARVGKYEMWKDRILLRSDCRFEELSLPSVSPIAWFGKFVAEHIRITLGGNLGFSPRIGATSSEAIVPDCLLAWLYLEFARRNDQMFNPPKRYIKCQVCPRVVEENKHARGRKKVCSEACRKQRDRLGLEEARRRWTG